MSRNEADMSPQSHTQCVMEYVRHACRAYSGTYHVSFIVHQQETIMSKHTDELDSLFNLLGQPVPDEYVATSPPTIIPPPSPATSANSTHVCETGNSRGQSQAEYLSVRLTPDQASWLRQHLAALRLDWYMQQRNLNAIQKRGEYLSPEARRLLDSIMQDLDASQPVLSALEEVTR